MVTAYTRGAFLSRFHGLRHFVPIATVYGSFTSTCYAGVVFISAVPFQMRYQSILHSVLAAIVCLIAAEQARAHPYPPAVDPHWNPPRLPRITMASYHCHCQSHDGDAECIALAHAEIAQHLVQDDTQCRVGPGAFLEHACCHHSQCAVLYACNHATGAALAAFCHDKPDHYCSYY